jgi:lactoylglutathione lyase
LLLLIVLPNSVVRTRNEGGWSGMAKAIHSMIRVLNEKRSVDFYSRAFGLSIADRFAFDGFTLVYLRNETADFELELTINHDRTEPYNLGDGYGHIAFAVANLDDEHARFEREGLAPKPIKEFFREGALLAKFFFVEDPDGYKIEVLQSHGRYQ